MDASVLLGPLAGGLAAGLAVAVPLGPIGLLVVARAARDGLGAGVAAGVGVAAADLCYAVVATVAGSRVAAALVPVADRVRVVSAVALVAVAGVGVVRTLREARRGGAAPGTPAAGTMPLRAAGGLFALTLLNPLTVATFAMLVVGLGAGSLAGAAAKTAFVVGVGAASLAWQSLLALAGTVAGRRLPARARLLTGVAGNALVLVLAAGLLIGG